MARRYLYFVRHGVYTNLSGPSEEPEGSLTAEGMQQSLLTGQRLAKLPITMIYHSTSQRASETCQIIASLLPGVPVQSSNLLRECIPVVPEELKDFFTDIPADWISKGSEQAQKACDVFLQPLGGEAIDHHEILISHGNLIGYLLTQALLSPMEAWPRLEINHCSVSKMTISARRFMKVNFVNDTSHLHDMAPI